MFLVDGVEVLESYCHFTYYNSQSAAAASQSAILYHINLCRIYSCAVNLGFLFFIFCIKATFRFSTFYNWIIRLCFISHWVWQIVLSCKYAYIYTRKAYSGTHCIKKSFVKLRQLENIRIDTNKYAFSLLQTTTYVYCLLNYYINVSSIMDQLNPYTITTIINLSILQYATQSINHTNIIIYHQSHAPYLNKTFYD